MASPMSKVSLLSRRLKALSQRFWVLQPKARITQLKQRVSHLERRLHDMMAQRVKRHRERLARDVAALSALSPLAVMGRGYAIVYQQADVVTSVNQVEQEALVRIRLADGSIEAKVTNRFEEDTNNG
jgi:exodeoxyribonuclease VII large subunit